MHNETPIGNAIQQARLSRRLSLSELARQTGLTKSGLSRIESGDVRRPTPETLERVAEALNLPAAVLFSLLDRQSRDALPKLQPYLRAKYDLPDSAIAEMSALLARYGRGGRGPREGEDEQPE